MTSSSNDREALITLLGGEEYARGGGPVFGNRALHPSQAVAIADAILAEFLPGYTERVKAEALRELADYLVVNAGDEDDEWWRGYRQGQRQALVKADRLASSYRRES